MVGSRTSLVVAGALSALVLLGCSSNGGDGEDDGSGAGATHGSNSSSGAGAGGSGPGPLDLCEGLTTDTAAHPLTPLAKPGPLESTTDPAFGTVVRRISDAGPGGVIKPMYSTIPAWNADESLLILYQEGAGHRLHDGRTYEFVRTLDIAPADIEQVYWHTTDPDVLFYVDGTTLVRYRVSSSSPENVATFDLCSEPASGGEDPMFMSWDSDVIGLRCGATMFTYRISTGAIASGEDDSHEEAPQASASGEYAFILGWIGLSNLEAHGVLDLANPYDHASLGRLADGTDTYNGIAFDAGPEGSDVGTLVVHQLNDSSWRVVIGPATGYPYPPGGTHVSAMAYRQPGWVFVSIIGDTTGAGVLDQELVLADTNPGGQVCRIAHHRAFGDAGPQGYFAEPHVVPSPSGTRALFGSDWGGGDSVDAYVVELPSYRP
jgi:hypothetical protein